MKAAFITTLNHGSGWDRLMGLRSEENIRALRGLGVEVLPVDVSAATEAPDETSRELASFAPDFVTSLNFNYYLAATREEDGPFDVLRVPTVIPWDDPLGALALYLTTCRDGRLGDVNPASPLDVLELFREIVRQPSMMHLSWDSGHLRIVEELGLAERAQLHWYPVATYSPFLSLGPRAETIAPETDVAFCGNVYANALRASGFWADAFLKGLAERVCERKARDLGRPVWNLLQEELEALAPGVRDRHGLDARRSSFWDYYVFVVWFAVNTLVRLGILGQVRRDVHLFGLFADPDSSKLLADYPNLVYRGDVDHFDELPRTYAAARINICLSNGLVAQGAPSKFVDCVASGGFALTDPKDDLVRIFGEQVDRVFFRDADELNEKIEYFLARPDERREITDRLGAIVRRECTLENMYRTVVSCAGSAAVGLSNDPASRSGGGHRPLLSLLRARPSPVRRIECSPVIEAEVGQVVEVTVALDRPRRQLASVEFYVNRDPEGASTGEWIVVGRQSVAGWSAVATFAWDTFGWQPGRHRLAVNVMLEDGEVVYWYEHQPRWYRLLEPSRSVSRPRPPRVSGLHCEPPTGAVPGRTVTIDVVAESFAVDLSKIQVAINAAADGSTDGEWVILGTEAVSGPVANAIFLWQTHGFASGEHRLGVNLFLEDGDVVWWYQQPPHTYRLT